jgi:CheY-like chemotaxis protein
MDIRMPRMDGIEALVAGLGDPRSDAADAFIIMSSDFGELKKKVRDPLEE